MKIVNRRAGFDYKLLDRYEAGVELSGGEVKAVKLKKVDLSNSFAKIIDNEIFLINASIPIVGKKDYSPMRARKLLLHKKQIFTIKTKVKAKKLTLVPTKVYTRGRLIKVEIATARAKRKFEKREAIKEREIEKEIKRELRGKKALN